MKINCSQSLLLASLLLALDRQPAVGQKHPDDVRMPKPAPGQLPHGKKMYPAMGMIERLDPALDDLIPRNAIIEKLASGFSWAEGPVWAHSDELLFSDVPRNIVFRWREGAGTAEYLTPSGYTLDVPRGGEQGSNGLTLDEKGRLVLCQHGNRQVARFDKKDHKFTVLARYYHYRRFNSPNDLVYKSNGDLYFTDPPYGLMKGNDDPAKELSFNGVYCIRNNGEVELLVDNLTFPNGLAFSPDEKTLYIAVSDPKHAVWMAYDVQADGRLGNARVFLDVTAMTAGKKGLPDGMKVDRAGNLFATGPGGVLIISPSGKHLGTLNTGEPTANCAWGGDGSMLYITANDKLCRIRTSTRGKMP